MCSKRPQMQLPKQPMVPCKIQTPPKPVATPAKCAPCITFLDRVLYMGLAGACVYGIKKLAPESCIFGAVSCAIGLVYGVFGALSSATKPPCLVAGILETFLDFGAIALFNIQIYKKEAPDLALFHWIFLIPMVLDLFAKLFGDESDDTATQNLKHLCNITNILAMIYISLNADNCMYSVAAILFLIANIGIAMANVVSVRFSENVFTIFTAAFYITAVMGLT